MQLYPAIDLKNGQCVRLRQGEFEHITVYSDEPEKVARRWQEQGATYLHLVDLDGAFQAAHTLKGVSGNLGLTPLYEVVCDIVEPLRHGEKRSDYPAMLEKIEEEFAKVRQMHEELTACQL